MEPFRPVLTIFAAKSSVYPNSWQITADVQIWRGNICVTTIRLNDTRKVPFSERFEPSCVEQFASITARVVARLIDEHLYEELEHRRVTTWHDLSERFPAPTSVPD